MPWKFILVLYFQQVDVHTCVPPTIALDLHPLCHALPSGPSKDDRGLGVL
jgi:hypothetical protein